MERAQKIAYQILSGFDKSYRWYSRITKGAQSRFEQRRWAASQLAIKERITIYEQSLGEVVTEIYHHVQPQQETPEFWLQMKNCYTKLIAHHPQFELAETFYNSVICRIFKHGCITNDMMFVESTRCYLPGQE